MSAEKVVEDLKKFAKSSKSVDLQRFFKTGPGDYAEGDVFIGVMVPETRKVAAKFKDLDLVEITKLTKSDIHEVRLCGLIILTNQYKRSKNLAQKKEIFNFYIREVKAGNVNNWDLVDVTAPTIGEYLLHIADPISLLKKLAKSKSLWERRTSMILTFALIRAGEFDATYEMAEYHLKDEQDLMHKSVGWMLREMGKRDPGLLRAFLKEHCQEMPRTALRYAIEKLPEPERRRWLLR